MTHSRIAPVSTHSDASIEELLVEVLRPLASILIESGIPESTVKAGFEQVRREINEKRSGQVPIRLGAKQRECMELMCLWRRSKEFLGPDGLPAVLPFSGASGSFTKLCQMVSTEQSAEAILQTLLEFGAVQSLHDGSVGASTPTFLLANPRKPGPLAADGVLKQLAGFLRVIEYNVRQSLFGRKSRFERACTVVIAQEYVPIFERVVRERGQMFIDVLDEWLERHRGAASPSGRYAEVGAGAYFVDLGNIEK
jgi:hypothetical protein